MASHKKRKIVVCDGLNVQRRLNGRAGEVIHIGGETHLCAQNRERISQAGLTA